MRRRAVNCDVESSVKVNPGELAYMERQIERIKAQQARVESGDVVAMHHLHEAQLKVIRRMRARVEASVASLEAQQARNLVLFDRFTHNLHVV